MTSSKPPMLLAEDVSKEKSRKNADEIRKRKIRRGGGRRGGDRASPPEGGLLCGWAC